MNLLMEKIITKTPLYDSLRNLVIRRRELKQLADWERNGRPIPPPHIVKQQTLKTISKRYGLKILVETGTYYGDMVEAMKDVFNQLYSIELSAELYKKAKKRFKGEKHIELICGDSGLELMNLMSKIDQPTLFWLDGHYSAGVTAKGEKDTPIYEELNHILNSTDKGHVIIIDDARCFGADPNYPSIKELCDFIKSKRANLDIVIQDDCIRVIPNQDTTNN
mgnify:CR=1 FL=1|jgi:hypothetical protein|tara:strand:+ start:244 stop:906 length:663 start_codon:yes stop_codon:yes gene_type:complete